MKACAWMRWVERGAGRVQCRGGRAEWLSRGGRACACARRECVRARRACMRQASCTHGTPPLMWGCATNDLNVEGGLFAEPQSEI